MRALLTRRANGGRKSLRKLWSVLEAMGAQVSWYADPVVKYHAKVAVTVLGSPLPGTLEPHGKLLIIDDTLAMIGSLALSTLSLDLRREVALTIDDAVAVRRLVVAYQELVEGAEGLATLLPGDRA